MKLLLHLLLSALLACAAAAPAWAELVVITVPSLQVRAAPQAGGKAIGVVYGNDTYDVIDEREDWVRIRTGTADRAGVTGWIPRKNVYPILEPIARKSFAYAQALKADGKDRDARAKLFEVMVRYPGTVQSYEATRLLQDVHQGQAALTAPENGVVDAKMHAQAARIASWLLVEEGKQLVFEKRYREAVSMFEEARARGKLNRSAMDGIRQALQAQYKSGDDRNAAMMGLRAYFPGIDDLENFRISPLGKPKRNPPTKSPLVPPGDPLEEQDGESGLHDFERKELEIAPENGGMPEQEKSEAMPAPEGAMPSTEGDSAAVPPEKPNEASTSPARAPSNAPPVQPAPKAVPPEIAPPPPPNTEPAQAMAPAPPDTPGPKSGQAMPVKVAAEKAAPAVHPPLDTPPGFAIEQGEAAQTPRDAANHPDQRGLWPGENAEPMAQATRPAPPPAFSELAERPASTSRR